MALLAHITVIMTNENKKINKKTNSSKIMICLIFSIFVIADEAMMKQTCTIIQNDKL